MATSQSATEQAKSKSNSALNSPVTEKLLKLPIMQWTQLR